MNEVAILPDEAARVLHEACNWCRWGNPKKSFSGMQPISLRRDDLRNLKKRANDYVVCEKTDGERYFLLIRGTSAYFIDRKSAVTKYLIPPLTTRSKLANLDSQTTLIDGEYVDDMFLIFDAIAVEGRDVLRLTLDQRLAYALDVIQLNPKHPLQLSMKDFFHLRHLEFVWRKVRPRLQHECDGLIFTPISEPYKAGTSQTLLKWKPGDFNTVDFKLEPVTVNEKVYVKLLVMNNDSFDLYGWLADGQEPITGIVECKWDPEASTYILNEDSWEQGGWVIWRQRTDKDLPNCILTATRVQATICEALQFTDLLSFLK